MTIVRLIADSEQLIQWLDKNIDGLEIKADTRSRLAAGCLDIALEHQKAIVILVSRKLHGSAFSLARLIFEAYVRGVWLHRCASDADLERFCRGKLKKEFGELIQEIEKLDGFNVGVLSSAKSKSWKAMNGYTHSGYLQVVRRNTAATIEPNYTDEEIVEAVNFTNAVALLSAMAIAFLSGSKQLANSILERAKSFWGVEP